MRVGGWAPNEFFNGDRLPSFIMWRHKSRILCFGDRKVREEFSYFWDHRWLLGKTHSLKSPVLAFWMENNTIDQGHRSL